VSSASCIELLEKYLRAAKRGNMTTVAISATGEENHLANFVGDIPDLPRQLASLKELTALIEKRIAEWTAPDTDASLDASYVCYHCGLAPKGFDFLTWLMVNEIIRVEKGIQGPLKVGLFEGPTKDVWADPVYRPMIKMIGAVEDPKALQRQGMDIYLTKQLVDMYQLNPQLPPLKAVGDWNLPRGVVTITLRESEHWPHRNSSLFEWIKFASWLKHNHNERVVFVRDTVKAEWPLDPYETCPTASTNLDARMWLYENAKLNCFVSNGPMMLSLFAKHPMLAFVKVEDEQTTNYMFNTPQFWAEKMGVPVGRQFPWSDNRQKIVWQKDTFDNLRHNYQIWRASC